MWVYDAYIRRNNKERIMELKDILSENCIMDLTHVSQDHLLKKKL